MARSVFYYHRQRSNKASKYERHKEVIKQIYDEHKGRYGYRRITQQMKNMGYTLNHKTVLKLMREMNLKGLKRKIRYNSYKGEIGEIAENLINRDFTADSPNKKWATDLTQIKIKDKWIYLSPILDMFNGEIISYSLSSNPDTKLVISMLEKAFCKFKSVEGIIIHSDRGVQYQSKEYKQIVEKHKMQISMSRKGNCYDNAMIESFFGIMKTELLYNQTFESQSEFIEELHKYIYYYNNIRIKNRLNGKSPVQYRTFKAAV